MRLLLANSLCCCCSPSPRLISGTRIRRFWREELSLLLVGTWDLNYIPCNSILATPIEYLLIMDGCWHTTLVSLFPLGQDAPEQNAKGRFLHCSLTSRRFIQDTKWMIAFEYMFKELLPLLSLLVGPGRSRFYRTHDAARLTCPPSSPTVTIVS